jgi:hypothetical protein
MKHFLFWAILIVFAFGVMVTPIGAAGPLDGAYALTMTGQEGEAFTVYLVVLQNDAQIALAVLEPRFFQWFYGFAALDAQQHVSGALLAPDSTDFGLFDLAFLAGGRVTGTMTFMDVLLTVIGGKFF